VSSAFRQLIAVRSLTDSDLGLFAAHRAAASSKQRAININSPVAKKLLGREALATGGALLDVVIRFRDSVVNGPRPLSKVHKNWRLGGPKIEGDDFALLDARDFLLMRTVAGNDGSEYLLIGFACRRLDPVVHAGVAAIVQPALSDSMATYEEGDPHFEALGAYCPEPPASAGGPGPVPAGIPPMPRSDNAPPKHRTVGDKLKSPHMIERMLQVAGDLSAPAQLRFMETVQQLATQLREVLLGVGWILRLKRNHASLWSSVAGSPIGFVDGGLANLSMLGSAPVAARVGGYVVTPGMQGADRESFKVLKYLIDELYAHADGGVYTDSFPDIGALRDAARISIEAAGAVRLLSDRRDLAWVMLHGALVNPVSRYTDVMQDGRVRHKFPNFSSTAIGDLLPKDEASRTGRDSNFVSVYLRQLELMQNSPAVVCGVVERESSTSSVCKAVLKALHNEDIRDVLPMPPDEWKESFLKAVNPADDDELEGQRITDPLLFRCVLEPGEALLPVPIDRNEIRRAPKAWQDVIAEYPRPQVSYLQASEWSAPVRVELFEKDLSRFPETASLVYHCCLLLPKYAFPVGLDIVDKFAKVPNWMSRPINTYTAVGALKRALDDGDSELFDSLRRMLCGSSREWLLRPGVMR